MVQSFLAAFKTVNFPVLYMGLYYADVLAQFL